MMFHIAQFSPCDEPLLSKKGFDEEAVEKPFSSVY